MSNSTYDETTREHVIHLENGSEIRSGWIDRDDPDQLPAGDYLSVVDKDGQQLMYVDSADLLADPIQGRRWLWELFHVCIAGTNFDVSICDPTQLGEET